MAQSGLKRRIHREGIETAFFSWDAVIQIHFLFDSGKVRDTHPLLLFFSVCWRFRAVLFPILCEMKEVRGIQEIFL